MSDSPLGGAPLGQDVAYPRGYDASLLFPIERATNRSRLSAPARWQGADIWNAYELSWLDAKGKPMVALGRFTFPWDSPRLVESKSFKLYLNSFNDERFDSAASAQARMAEDLSEACGAAVEVALLDARDAGSYPIEAMAGDCIDGLDVGITHYQPSPDLLRTRPRGGRVTETLVSELLKSNCPVTGQPDWATVQVSYTGTPIDRAALLAYIVSLRHHSEFHEHCVERMYCDLMAACRPESLLVYARYTRRGGLDINPWRASDESFDVSQARTPRQ